MAETYRTINTRFWSDNFIRKLNALDRYFFLYLLTNEHVNWCGIYELEIGMMAFECGIDKEDLQKTMLPRLDPKIVYVDGWIFIKNFAKYHQGGINAEKGRISAIQALPERIRTKISQILGEDVLKANPLEGVPPSASASTFALTATTSQRVQDKKEETLTQLDDNGNPLKVRSNPLGKITPPIDKSNPSLSIALMWQKMVSNHFSIPKEDIPPINVIKPISVCMEKYKFTAEEFKDLFKHFLDDDVTEQKKLNIYLCLSDTYISQYKVYQKITPKTNAWISGEIKL